MYLQGWWAAVLDSTESGAWGEAGLLQERGPPEWSHLMLCQVLLRGPGRRQLASRSLAGWNVALSLGHMLVKFTC